LTTIKEILNSSGGGGFFKVEEVQRRADDGEPVVVTIKGFVTEKMKKYQGDEMEDTDILSFEETSKRLILNSARKEQLADLIPAGQPVEGHKIALAVRLKGAIATIVVGAPE
jgi:hypothetical protein